MFNRRTYSVISLLTPTDINLYIVDHIDQPTCLWYMCIYTGPTQEDSDSDSFTHEMRGIIPRGFEYLFSLINREIEKVLVTCMPMYVVQPAV